MQVEAAFPADSEAAELVQQGDGLLDEVAQLAQALDALAPPGGDDRCGAASAAGRADGAAVVSLVGQQYVEAAAGPPPTPGDRRSAGHR